MKTIFLFLIILILISNLHSQIQTSLEIYVSRADNGRPIPGAQINLFGAYNGNYTTDGRGKITLKKVLTRNDVRGVGVMTLTAKGYIPAARSNVAGNPGGFMVAYREFSAYNKNHTIGLTLQPKSQYSQRLSPPQLISPLKTGYRRNDGYLVFKWEPVNGAYQYQLWFADNPDFRNAKMQYIDHVRGTNEQAGSARVPYRYVYWKVRASDGSNENVSDYSETGFCEIIR